VQLTKTNSKMPHQTRHLNTNVIVLTRQTYGAVMSAQYRLWTDIIDIVRSVHLWPRQTRRNFRSSHLNHWERLRTAAFIWVNGLNPQVFCDWCDLTGRLVLRSPEQHHFRQLFGYFEQGCPYRLSAWNISNGRCEWLNGSMRLPRQ
jgi:hypothetical protein